MRTDLSSIKEADSSVNGVVAYFILLSGAALQHPPPAKRRCNLSGEINIKCMCKAMTYVGLGIACTSLNLVIAKMSVISYPALHALCFIVIFSYLAYLHVYSVTAVKAP